MATKKAPTKKVAAVKKPAPAKQACAKKACAAKKPVPAKKAVSGKKVPVGSVKVYHEKDASLDVLKGKTVAVLGYGAQGRAQALCMRDSGVNVIIGVRAGKSFKAAKADGFEVMPVDKAAKKADIIHILLPDEKHNEV
ncbi:MAG: NAD(P)-binding domain-containing protein, partial [Opitutales bacterium]|nr:NAD(P)-binding domain-containing protein [Opitutales bacterium]